MQTIDSYNEDSIKRWGYFGIGLFLTAAWCVKDHSISLDELWGMQRVEGVGLITSGRISLEGLFTLNAQGEAETTSWTKQELETVHKYISFLCVTQYPQERMEKIKQEPALEKVSAVSKKDGASYKIEHFFNIISRHVRPERDLSFRITFMIQALEALLSTSQSELVYRLSLRVALILGNSPSERNRIFLTMKGAYDVRSKTIHGNTFKLQKIKTTIPALAQELDEYCRRIARRLFDDPEFLNLVEGDDQDLEDAMLEGILKAGFNPPNMQSG